MMRALVLERRGRHAIVLLAGGEIRRVRATGALVGDEILLPAREQPRPQRRFGYAVAGLALVLAVLPAELPLAQAKVAAYVTVDINPSVELGLSAGGTVLTSRGLDQDGLQLLAAAGVRGESLSAAVGSLLHTASAEGFISAHGPAAVIVAGYGAGAQRALPQKVQRQLRSARSLATGFLRSHGLHGVVSAMIVPRVLVQAAGRAHVSAGVYAVWSALHKAGVVLRVGDLRGKRLGPTMAKIAGTASGKTVLPFLTGRSGGQSTGAGRSVKPHGRMGGDAGGSGAAASQASSPGGTGPGADGGQSASARLQVEILTPGGTLQLQVGGDGQALGGQGKGSRGDGHGQAPGVLPGGPSPDLTPGTGQSQGKGTQGRGQVKGGRDDGHGQAPGVLPRGSSPGLTPGTGQSQGKGTQGRGQGKETQDRGHGHSGTGVPARGN